MLQNKHKSYGLFFVTLSLALFFLLPQTSAAAVPPFGMYGWGYELENVKDVEGVQIVESVQSEEEIQEEEEFGEIMRLNLDAETITKGYTVSTDDEVFKVGITPNSVTVPVQVVLKRIDPTHIPFERTLEKMSDIYGFDVRELLTTDNLQLTTNETKSLGVLEKPIHLALKFDLETLNKKIIHFWNKPEQRWVPLKSNTDFYGGYVRATINLPFARLALFDDLDVYEGWASWYKQFNDHYAAATIWPRGTQLKVTNISGSSRHGRSVEVKVNDYGPDPEVFYGTNPLSQAAKRVIDLADHAYLHIAASLKSGIMPVRVELID